MIGFVLGVSGNASDAFFGTILRRCGFTPIETGDWTVQMMNTAWRFSIYLFTCLGRRSQSADQHGRGRMRAGGP
jgi:hypothetical protein